MIEGELCHHERTFYKHEAKGKLDVEKTNAGLVASDEKNDL